MTKLVPNLFPTRDNPTYHLAIIGEAPGRDEETAGRPFVGVSGRFLGSMLARAGISLDDCFIGNISQHRPPENEIKLFPWDGPEIQSGLAQLHLDLRTFRPNLCLLLGNTPLRAAKYAGITGKKIPNGIGDWRGSLFSVDHLNSPFYGYKCMGTYHPAYVLRDYSTSQVFFLDLKRAASQAQSSTLNLPQRELCVPSTADECVGWLRELRSNPRPTAIDIEGYVHDMTMCSFATSRSDGFIVPFAGPYYNGSFWNEDEEATVWKEFVAVLEDSRIPKILQNSLYDRFVLQYGYGIVVRNVRDDIMLKHWELFCELEKSLGFQASIYTYEPFYKSERKSDDWQTKFRYCVKDSCVTKECNEVEDGLLKDPGGRAHYEFNVRLLEPILYMENSGIRYDIELAAKYRTQCELAINVEQEKLNSLAGREINIRSPKQMCDLLYKELRLPLQTNDLGRPTTNYEALLSLWKKTKNPICELGMHLRELATRLSMLAIQADPDGRIRCGYNIVGSETGRITCYTSPTGSGYNLQTIPSDNPLRPKGHPLHLGMRRLIRADDHCDMGQCDLAGADSWTVAAYCAMLGDGTMLEDLYAGLKPAQVLVIMYKKGAVVNTYSRTDLKDLWKDLDLKKSFEYFMCKIGTHGSCYLMGVLKLTRQTFLQSEGSIVATSSEIERIQSLFFTRYWGVKKWHHWMGRKLQGKAVLVSASGHRRQFFGRPQEILGQALANEPQENTTYATNLAVERCWLDPENREVGGRLHIEPLHQVHDAFIPQWKTERREWAVGKIRQYFNNPLTIAGQTITIPFEGAYGRSWGELEDGKI